MGKTGEWVGGSVGGSVGGWGDWPCVRVRACACSACVLGRACMLCVLYLRVVRVCMRHERAYGHGRNGSLSVLACLPPLRVLILKSPFFSVSAEFCGGPGLGSRMIFHRFVVCKPGCTSCFSNVVGLGRF